MSIELLLLTILGGITVLAYMVAINSHGPTRLSISYLCATMLLAITIWAVVQHVNRGVELQNREVLQRLESEKKQAIELAESTLRMSQEKSEIAGKLSTVINQATALATTMTNIDLRDMSMDLSALIARANETKAKVALCKEQQEKLHGDDKYFSHPITLLREAITALSEAAQYYVLYYRAEDTAQEELRERVMRQKAREAFEKCQQASALIASSK